MYRLSGSCSLKCEFQDVLYSFKDDRGYSGDD